MLTNDLSVLVLHIEQSVMSVWLSVVTLKHPKTNEQAQEVFQQKMKAYEGKPLVYLDESGIDMPRTYALSGKRCITLILLRKSGYKLKLFANENAAMSIPYLLFISKVTNYDALAIQFIINLAVFLICVFSFHISEHFLRG